MLRNVNYRAKRLSVFVEFDVKDLIIPYRNTDMASLMVLVAVQTTDVAERPVRKNRHFIY